VRNLVLAVERQHTMASILRSGPARHGSSTMLCRDFELIQLDVSESPA
jgi:hypothetical protein